MLKYSSFIPRYIFSEMSSHLAKAYHFSRSSQDLTPPRSLLTPSLFHPWILGARMQTPVPVAPLAPAVPLEALLLIHFPWPQDGTSESFTTQCSWQPLTSAWNVFFIWFPSLFFMYFLPVWPDCVFIETGYLLVAVPSGGWQSAGCIVGAQWMMTLLPKAALGPTFSCAHLVPNGAYNLLDLGSVQNWSLNGSNGT